MERYGSNIIKSTLVHENHCTNIIGVYIPPSENDLSTMNELDTIMKNLKWEQTIVLGDLNVNYSKPKDERSERIVESLMTYDLFDVSTRFKSKKNKPFNMSLSLEWILL